VPPGLASDVADVLDVNHRYLVSYVLEALAGRELVVLDFGCGRGTLVRALRNDGVNCLGVDIFYQGAEFTELFESELFREGVIRQIGDDGLLPFDDASVDLIISNQVFEHVERLEIVMAELKRVLKPNGVMYHHFPSREVLREGHIGIPLAHRLPPGRFRYAYTCLLRRLGLGYHHDERPASQWAEESLKWLDAYCYYRPYRRVRALLTSDFVLRHREIDYCRFRARGVVARVLAVDAVRPFAEHVFRRLAFMAIELRPLASAREPPRGT
jgi:SAM-dependent methyltransferase